MLGDVFFRRRAPSVLRGAVSCGTTRSERSRKHGQCDELAYVSHDPLWKLERSSYIWLERGREERKEGRIRDVDITATKQSLVYFALARQAVICVLIVGHGSRGGKYKGRNTQRSANPTAPKGSKTPHAWEKTLRRLAAPHPQLRLNRANRFYREAWAPPAQPNPFLPVVFMDES